MSRSRRSPRNSASSTHLSRVRVIGGQWRGRWIEFPQAQGLRPTGDRMRETLFNWLRAELAEAHCVDLYAGSGALGIEAVSRGAASTLLIDSNSQVATNLIEQTCKLDSERFDVRCVDALHFLDTYASSQNATPINIAFVDPPFAENQQMEALRLMANSGLLAEHACVYVEAPVQADIVSDLPAGYRLHRSQIQAQVQCLLLHWQRGTL